MPLPRSARQAAGNCLSMIRTQLQHAGRSDKGLVRVRNEDCIAVFPESGLVVVADGMGGANAGEVASHMAVETIAEFVLPWAQNRAEPERGDFRELVHAAVSEANQIVFNSASEKPELQGMGTTVVVGLFLDRQLLYAHVGDSRLYRLRQGRMECLTVDHSVIQELVDQGMFASLEEAEAAGVANNVLTRALGIDDAVGIDLASTELYADDIYLFCTDGLTNMVDDRSIDQLILQGQDDLDAVANRLVEHACQNGGIDNISLVLVRI